MALDRHIVMDGHQRRVILSIGGRRGQTVAEHVEDDDEPTCGVQHAVGADQPVVRLEKDGGIGVIIVNYRPVNALGPGVADADIRGFGTGRKMGTRKKNYCNDVAVRLGYEGEAKSIQDLYLDGKRNDAAALVPDALADEISLCGSAERIKDRPAVWKECTAKGHIGTMVLKGASVDAMRVVAEAVL